MYINKILYSTLLTFFVVSIPGCDKDNIAEFFPMPPQGSATTEFPDPPSISKSDRLMPYKNNRFIWQYQEKPVILIGGTANHNAFNHPDTAHPEIEWNIERALDEYQAAGVNFMRNTMSHMSISNVFPYLRRMDTEYDHTVDKYASDDEKLFDLRQPNAEYWNRFARFLNLAYKRNIIVQVEVWELWDYFNDTHSYWHPYGGWSQHPFNPKNNINYSAEETGLPEYVNWSAVHDPDKIHPFFHSVPKLLNLKTVLEYQKRFVNKILDISLPYPNVIYCMHNETPHAYEVGEYWAEYIKTYGADKGYSVQTGEMRFRHEQFTRIIDRPDLFDFVDISQNSNITSDDYWYKLAEVRNRILHTKKRPIQNVKIYGSKIESSWRQNEDEAIETFWQLILGGAASARFHRPPAGIGMVRGESEWSGNDWEGKDWNDLPLSIFKSFHLLKNEVDLFTLEPDIHFRQLTDRSPGEAYLAYTINLQYVIYFPYGGDVKLGLLGTDGTFDLQWLDIRNSKLSASHSIRGDNIIELKSPDQNHWLAILTRN